MNPLIETTQTVTLSSYMLQIWPFVYYGIFFYCLLSITMSLKTMAKNSDRYREK